MPSAVFFPESRVASRGEQTSPVTQPEPMHGPDNQQLFQTMPDPVRDSAEQGYGRSPGQRWPHMPHVEQYDFDALANMGWRPGGDSPDLSRPETFGWSIPLYYEQWATGHHVWPEPIAIESPLSRPYTSLASVPA